MKPWDQQASYVLRKSPNIYIYVYIPIDPYKYCIFHYISIYIYIPIYIYLYIYICIYIYICLYLYIWDQQVMFSPFPGERDG